MYSHSCCRQELHICWTVSDCAELLAPVATVKGVAPPTTKVCPHRAYKTKFFCYSITFVQQKLSTVDNYQNHIDGTTQCASEWMSLQTRVEKVASKTA